jgi:DNA-binding response OmpR family regulator
MKTKSKSAEKKLILVVDDEKGIRNLLKRFLEMNNFEVITASDGEEALGKIREYSPDTVILDIIMPKMDGWEACREIRKDPIYKSIPILMLTSKTSKVDKITGLNIGADEYVTKPFELKEILLRIKKLI